jgi:hypothetical protein
MEFFFYGSTTRVWIHLLCKCSTISARPPDHFVLVIFKIWTMILLCTYVSYVAGITGTCHHASFYWLRWGLTNFLPGLALNLKPQSFQFLPL